MKHYLKYETTLNAVQKLIDKFYRYPLSKWRLINRFGGYFAYKKMLKGQKEMANTSQFLPAIISYADGLPIYFLTGKKFLYQTLFCAFSLTRQSNEKFQFILIDDGSFDESLTTQAQKQMPNVKIITANEIEVNLNKYLPKNQFPYLHHKRKIYPHIKKLTDIHTIFENEYKLVLDSDMLFWKNPIEIIQWLNKPYGAIHMIDCKESYGYSPVLMANLCNCTIPNLVNVGVFGLASKTINWSELEKWTKTLEEKEGASYFLEQALSAMLIASQERIVLKADCYIVNPTNIAPQHILKHYVDLSKKEYFEKEWKKIIK